MSNAMDAYWSAHEEEHGPRRTVSDAEIADAIRASVLRWVRDGSPGFNLPMIPGEIRNRIEADTKRRIAAGWSDG